LWVLAQQVDVNAVGLLLLALVLIGMAAWAFGLAQRGAQKYRWVALGAALIAVYATVSATGADNVVAARTSAGASEGTVTWQPWSRTAVEQSIAAGKPVFVDFTAAWCVTCQANKRLVLKATAVEGALRDRDVVLMRADWTNRDAEITRELARFNRNGVPLYVLYDGKGRTQVLPELLTERTVLDALARL
jgi:thiol:disulfide interchange protein DsbD